MKRITSVISSFVLMLGLAQNVVAQYSYDDDLYYDNRVTYEVGGHIGAMNCLTDLGGGKGTGKKFIKDLNVDKSQFSGGIFLCAAYRYAVVLRTEATWGSIKADDKVLAKVKETTLGRYDRNLNFKSTVYEVMLAAEIHPLYFKKYKKGTETP